MIWFYSNYRHSSSSFVNLSSIMSIMSTRMFIHHFNINFHHFNINVHHFNNIFSSCQHQFASFEHHLNTTGDDIQEAAERGVPCPTLAAALDMRYLSSLTHVRQECQKCLSSLTHVRQERQTCQKCLSSQTTTMSQDFDKTRIIEDARQALYCSKICSYAQGLMLLQTTSKIENWNLNISEIARIWKGGCIIRAQFLDRIKNAFAANNELTSLMNDPYFAEALKNGAEGWRRIIGLAQSNGVPVPAMSASLNYFDAFRAPQLPLNLVQAQRDYFGSHTYARTDRPGVFSTTWS